MSKGRETYPGCNHRPSSKAQRLRFVLYIVWKKAGIADPFEQFYAEELEKIISDYKKLLPP